MNKFFYEKIVIPIKKLIKSFYVMEKKSLLFEFDDSAEKALKGKESFVAVLKEKVDTKTDLLNSLSEILHFPEYFGKNWDALRDLFNDFHWITNKEIILIHKDIPLINDPQNLHTYLKILNDAIASWKPNEKHHLTIIFPQNSKETLVKALNIKQNRELFKKLYGYINKFFI